MLKSNAASMFENHAPHDYLWGPIAGFNFTHIRTDDFKRGSAGYVESLRDIGYRADTELQIAMLDSRKKRCFIYVLACRTGAYKSYLCSDTICAVSCIGAIDFRVAAEVRLQFGRVYTLCVAGICAVREAAEVVGGESLLLGDFVLFDAYEEFLRPLVRGEAILDCV